MNLITIKVSDIRNDFMALQQSLCADPDKTVNIKKQKQFLGMAMGKVSIHTDIVHDTVSCGK